MEFDKSTDCWCVSSKLNLRPSNQQLMVANLQIQYSYLLDHMHIYLLLFVMLHNGINNLNKRKLHNLSSWPNNVYLCSVEAKIYSVRVIFYKISYSETCVNRTLNIPETSTHKTLEKVPMQEIVVSLICINQTLVYSEH
jgi:hypothetical protein